MTLSPVARAAGIDSETVRVELAIDAMTCGSRAVTARVVLRRMQGIVRAELSHDSARAVIWYHAARITPDRIIKELRERTGDTAHLTDAHSRVCKEASDVEVR